MTPPINSVSPERLDELAQWAASEEADCLHDDMPISAGYYADIIKLIAARRAANTPVDGVAWEQAARTFLSGDDFETLQSLAVAFAEDQAAGVDTSLKPASPAMPSQVGVKPLPWKENGASSIWTGELQFGVYYTIYVESAGWRVFRHQFLSETSETEIAFVSSLASAKAAAQANFDQAIQSCLTSPAAEPGEDKLDRLIDFIIGPSVSDADYDADAERDLAIDEGRYTISDELRDLQQSIMQCRTLKDLRAVQITVQHIRTHPAPSASREVADEMVANAMTAFVSNVRGQDPEWTDDVDEGEVLLTSPSGDYFALEYPLRAALLAALPEREGQMGPKPRAEIEIETAASILRAMGNTIEQMERWWPASKRGSNASREWENIKSQRATALQCLLDAQEPTNDH